MSRFSSEIDELSEQLDRLLEQTPRDRGAVTFRSILRSMTFGFFEEYAQWRYEHPILSRLVSIFRAVLVLVLITAFAWWLAGTAAGRVTGLDGVKSRFVFGYYSLVWASKGAPDIDAMQLAPKRFSGTIEKVVGDVLVVSYYDQGKSVRRLVRPANVVITNKEGFNEWAKQYILKGVTIDFYIPIDKASGYDVWAVVFWSNRVPINVQLVEKGYGTPESNPITQIINQVYSGYYMQRARSG